jgi:hypothetical protein
LISTKCIAHSSKATRPTILKGRSTLVGASYQKMLGFRISCERESAIAPVVWFRLGAAGR